MSEKRGASEVELVALGTAADRYDVAILGGGLAGLTLAIQLKRRRPATRVVVLERRAGPAPDAAFKVGESTVLSGAHYFSHVVGMDKHLREGHIVKCALRFFAPDEGNSDITQRLEIGGPAYPPHDDFQIDRGRFENELAAVARALGVNVLGGCKVGEVGLGAGEHRVGFVQGEAERVLHARWVVDATGRGSLLRRQLGIGRNVNHRINASWLRLRAGLDLERWGADNADWMARMTQPGIRQFSTNHLLGEGYWVWLIPLGTGSISIGVCADPRFHSFQEINELGRFMDWMSRHEPQLAADLDARLTDVLDFLRVEDFAYGVERAFSPDRWCLVGEAAAFADPFYSPGSDMIGYGNSFACDLICRDIDGEDISERLEFFNDFYFRTFDHILSRTEDQYALFGNPQVTLVKLNFDDLVHHVGTVIVFLKDKLTDLELMRSIDEDIDRIYRLSIRMQQLFHDWNDMEGTPWHGPARGSPHRLLIEGLFEPTQDYPTDEALRGALKKHVRWVEAMAVLIFHKAASALPVPPDRHRSINPYVMSLNSDAWQGDGLYEPPGWTLADAAGVAEGFENLWLDGVTVAG